QPIELTLRPAVFDRHVLALDVADLLHALAELAHTVRQPVGRPAVEKPDRWHCRLLRARRERPRSRRPPAHPDECAPFHSMTSSARASSVGGISRPSAFAVLRLMAVSYLVGVCTGRSAGFSPFRIRST